MIFGRKRKQLAAQEAEVPDSVEEPETPVEELAEVEADADVAVDGDDQLNQEVDEELDEELDEQAREWLEWDAAFEREEGPFDIEEVDLDADDVKRIDLGTLIVTPFPKMSIQLQVDKKKEKVQAILVADGSSAIEVAVFAGPSRSTMNGEIRSEVIKATERAGGRASVVKGPFGAEIHRRLPVTDSKGKPAMHMSRTWLASGPGWVLRGVVMGKAALNHQDEVAQLTLLEFFSNLVVRRGTQPAVPGSMLPMTVPQLDKDGQNTVTESASETPQG